MQLKKIMATVTVAGALSAGAAGLNTVGLGVGVAGAHPGAPVPMKPHGDDDNGPHGPGNDRGPSWKPGPGGNQGDWHDHDHDFNVGSRDWWRGRPGKWWGDDALPPWGFWGPPPPVQWSGPPPWVDAHPVNYWGYRANPVWDDGFHGWGIWLFGIWIPIVGIQGY